MNTATFRNAGAVVGIVMLAAIVRAEVITWPVPQGEAKSPDYTVNVDGTDVGVYTAKSVHGGDYSFCVFDFTGSVTVTVSSRRDLGGAVIRPLSYGIKPAVKDGAMTFALDRPRKISVEPEGIKGPLLIFAGEPEKDAPRQGDAGVIYFGPGVHKPERIILKSDQTLYLAGGAVVKGAVIAESVRNVRIRGRGILDGTDWPWLKGPAGQLVSLRDCSDISVEGVTLRGSFAWTLVPMRCERVSIRNVRLVNSRVQNDDGINPCNSRDVTIEDCFIRSDDDCIAMKGLFRAGGQPPQAVSGIAVRGCVFWCDRARIFLLGHESVAPAMEDIVVSDCDIVHYSMTPFLLEPGEEMALRNVRFENIRMEGDGGRDFIVLRPTVNQYMKVKTPGSIANVVFSDITLSGARAVDATVVVKGADDRHGVTDVTFRNVVRYGQVLTESSPGVQIGAYTKGIRFVGPSAPAGR